MNIFISIVGIILIAVAIGLFLYYVNKVVINNADFEESYNKAIADKQKAQLAAEQQEIVNQQNIDKADADAKAAVTKANGDAEAKKIAAEAEAKANETLEKSITEKILKDKYIEKWNGQLPKVVSDDSSMLFNIDGADTNKGE